jgi:hypothetical protein
MSLSEKKELISNVLGIEFLKRFDDRYLNSIDLDQINAFLEDSMNPKTNPLLEDLWMKAEESIMPMTISHPALFIKGKIFEKEIDFLLDTGAQNCVIDYDLVRSLGLEEYIDKSQRGVVMGIGQNITHGVIPYLEIDIEGSLYPITFTVMSLPEKLNSKPLIGLNFLMFYNAKLDFEKRKLHIMGQEKNLIIKEGH